MADEGERMVVVPSRNVNFSSSSIRAAYITARWRAGVKRVRGEMQAYKKTRKTRETRSSTEKRTCANQSAYLLRGEFE
jgi:hypothetical protein